MDKVSVAASKNYDILIGNRLLERSGNIIKEKMLTDKAFIVTDDIVASLYLDKLQNSLEAVGINTAIFVFPNGEHSKNAETYIKLLNKLAECKIHRTDTIIALGGGVVGDLTGFAAATYLRGVPFIQIPTTLLSAVDSSVGGKTAIDLDAGKNLAGAFYQPELVLCDTDTLVTLDETNLKCGMAEVVKYAFLCDKSFYESLLSKRLTYAEIIKRCVEIKSDVVAQDEFDTSARKMLNLGHTLGHAIEALSKYEIPHGLAVSMGMMEIAKISYNNGLCDELTVQKTEELLNVYELPTSSPYSLSEMSDKMTSDKKVEGKKIDLIIPREIGKCEIHHIPLTELKSFIEKGSN